MGGGRSLSPRMGPCECGWEGFGQKMAQWAHNVPLSHGALSADGRRALTVSEGGNLQIWDTDSGRARPILECNTGPVWDCALRADGHHALFLPRPHSAALGYGQRAGNRAVDIRHPSPALRPKHRWTDSSCWRYRGRCSLLGGGVLYEGRKCVCGA